MNCISTLSKLSRQLCLYGILIATFAMQGCPGGTTGGGQLIIELEGNILNVGAIKSLEKVNRSFRIYNQGMTPIIVTQIEIQKGQNILAWSGPALPLTLQPGKDNGTFIDVTVKPDNSTESGDIGRIVFNLQDAIQTRTFVIVKAQVSGQVQPTKQGKLSWECGGLIDFGVVQPNKSAKRQCLLKNIGTGSVSIDAFNYVAKSGNNAAFTLGRVNAPLTLEAGESQLVDVTYTADGKHAKDEGSFTPSTQPKEATALLGVVGTQAQKQVPCELKVNTTELRFKAAGEQNIKISNPSQGICTINKIYLQNGGKGVFSLNPPPGHGITLQPGGALAVKVSFNATNPGSYIEDMLIDSDAPLSPRLRVVLRGEKAGTRTCKLAFSPSQTLNFGIVKPGETQTKTIEFTNVTGSKCTVSWSPRIVGTKPAGNQAFQLVSSSAGTILSPGQALGLMFGFIPKSTGSFEGEFTIQTDSTVNPTYKVTLQGAAMTLCLEVTPKTLDFGTNQTSCASNKQTVTIAHTGNKACGPVNINSISIKQTGAPFRIDSGKPQTLQPGQSMTVEVSHKPTKAGIDKATLLITNGVPGQSPMEVGLLGEGVTTADQTDTYKQQGKPKVDLLFVMDNSCSMGDDQYALAQESTNIFGWLQRLGIDFHVGVINTDTTGRQHPAGCLFGSIKYITPSTPNAAAVFSKNIQPGTRGSAQEKGIDAAYHALRNPALSGCNKGFYRKDANLSIVFISDEADQSPQPLATYINFFKSLKGAATAAKMRASVIGGPPPSGCRSNSAVAQGMPRYFTIAKQFGGVEQSFCDPNRFKFLSDPKNISKFGLGSQSQFTLSRQANPNTIVVKVNGTTIPNNPQNGWSFDAKTNSVIFSNNTIPAANSSIIISYKAACLP